MKLRGQLVDLPGPVFEHPSRDLPRNILIPRRKIAVAGKERRVRDREGIAFALPPDHKSAGCRFVLRLLNAAQSRAHADAEPLGELRACQTAALFFFQSFDYLSDIHPASLSVRPARPGKGSRLTRPVKACF